jgi:hypothetical protein
MALVAQLEVHVARLGVRVVKVLPQEQVTS